MLTRIRRMVYEMGFRPKLYSIFFSPTMNDEYTWKDAWPNGFDPFKTMTIDRKQEMSICLVAPIDPNHTIFAGWDCRLNTHYAQVLDPTKVGQKTSSVVLWIGSTQDEVPDIAMIAEALRPYALFDKNGLVIDQYL